MRKWLFLAVLASLAATAGCATVTRTPEENRYLMRQSLELQCRAIGDDWNLISQADRSTRLVRWYTR